MMKFPATDIEFAMQDEIDALIAERDKLQRQLKTVAEMGCRNCAPTRAEWRKCEAERDKLTKEVDVYKAMLTDAESEVETLVQQRDKLLKDRADLVERVSVLEKCLHFFRSVIKSGEPWTATCQREYDRALSRTSEEP